MAHLCVGVPQRLRQCAGDCAFEELTRSADRHSMDLVGSSNKFRKSREGKTPSQKDRRGGR
jgi:hypothetical protein